MFNEANTVEQLVLDVASGGQASPFDGLVAAEDSPGWGSSPGSEARPRGWAFVSPQAVPRRAGEVLVEPWLREAILVLHATICGIA